MARFFSSVSLIPGVLCRTMFAGFSCAPHARSVAWYVSLHCNSKWDWCQHDEFLLDSRVHCMRRVVRGMSRLAERQYNENGPSLLRRCAGFSGELRSSRSGAWYDSPQFTSTALCLRNGARCVSLRRDTCFQVEGDCYEG